MSSINLNEELNCSTLEVYLSSITLNALYSEKSQDVCTAATLAKEMRVEIIPPC